MGTFHSSTDKVLLKSCSNNSKSAITFLFVQLYIYIIKEPLAVVRALGLLVTYSHLLALYCDELSNPQDEIQTTDLPPIQIPQGEAVPLSHVREFTA